MAVSEEDKELARSERKKNVNGKNWKKAENAKKKNTRKAKRNAKNKNAKKRRRAAACSCVHWL